MKCKETKVFLLIKLFYILSAIFSFTDIRSVWLYSVYPTKFVFIYLFIFRKLDFLFFKAICLKKNIFIKSHNWSTIVPTE